MNPIRKQCRECSTQHDLDHVGPCESCFHENWRLWCSTHSLVADPTCKKCEKEKVKRGRRSKDKIGPSRKRGIRPTVATKLRCIACETIHEPSHIGRCRSCGYSVCKYWCTAHLVYLPGPRCKQCAPKRARRRAAAVERDVKIPEEFPTFSWRHTEPPPVPPTAPTPPSPPIPPSPPPEPIATETVRPTEPYPTFDKAWADTASRVREPGGG